MSEKNLTTIEKNSIDPEKIINKEQYSDVVGNVSSIDLSEDSKINNLGSNHILNLIQLLKSQQQEYVWFEIELPSNGNCN